MWYLTVKEQTESNGIVKCPYDDAFFSNNDVELQGLMTIHVDDFIYAGSEHFEDIIVNNVLHNVDVKTMDATDFTYLGLEIKQLEDKSITVSQNKYIQRELHEIPISLKRKGQKIHALSPTEYKQYRSVCGQLLWLSVQTRPDISFDTCMLQNHLSDPNVADILYANKVIKKLKLENDYILHFKGFQDGRSLKIVCYSDSAHNNLPKNGSQYGFIIFLCDFEETVKNPIAWRSA